MKYLSKAKPKDLRGTALVRLDFNTEDEWRMEATIPSLRLLVKYADKVVVMSHRGRPSFDKNGKPATADVKKLTLAHDAKRLSRYLRKKAIFIPDMHFATITLVVARAPRKSLIVLENLRFNPGEEANDERFAHSLAALGNYYVNDAFAVSHRDDASVDAITRFLPSYVGLELEQEIIHLSRAMLHPKRPLVVVLGGGKAHDKLGVIKHFRSRADALLLGGACANTVLKLRGVNVKKSVIDRDAHDTPMLRAAAKAKNVITPVDWKMQRNIIMDIGPKTIKLYVEKLKAARTIVWSGPMGMIEIGKFRKGNLAVAKAIATNRQAFSVTGGGETVMFLKKYKLDRKFSFISTGGGAMLDFLAGESLPGIAALRGASPRLARASAKRVAPKGREALKK